MFTLMSKKIFTIKFPYLDLCLSNALPTEQLRSKDFGTEKNLLCTRTDESFLALKTNGPCRDAQAGLHLCCSQIPEDRFSCVKRPKYRIGPNKCTMYYFLNLSLLVVTFVIC